ncbi:MAG TPA: NfeD family protein [Usitatibacter sp.]|jgi:membrane protein implicated in regulation of membrane protease activity|nr:NfeD family protein [Usitatibacter sp.]
MELWLIWLIAGFVLAIAEMMTGTFYLLVIAVGAFVGAFVAWLGMNELAQAAIGVVTAIAGVVLVHHWHSRNRPGEQADNFLDRGQPVVLEGWANETSRIARVKYRGASWDARLARPDERPLPGTTLYIEGQEGNTLVVGLAPPVG